MALRDKASKQVKQKKKENVENAFAFIKTVKGKFFSQAVQLRFPAVQLTGPAQGRSEFFFYPLASV